MRTNFFAPAMIALGFGTGLTVSAAAADDAALRQRIEAAQLLYEKALVAGDAAGVAALFTADGVLMPFSGGAFAGTDAIREFTAQRPGLDAIDVASQSSEVSGAMVFDVGTFTSSAGGREIRGEYVAWLDNSGPEIKLRRLITLLPRMIPTQAAAR